MPWFWNKDIQNDNNTVYVKKKGRKLFMILTADFRDVLVFIFIILRSCRRLFADVIVYIIPH